MNASLALMKQAALSGKLVCIVGPTASGKSALALALCEQIDGELVSADSVQVYKRFRLGTSKPSAEERARVPHHLVDFLEPHDTMTGARYPVLADAAIADIRARGKVPVVCGGTFLWVRALVRGIVALPDPDPQIRALLEHEAQTLGRAALHERLRRVDPESALRLHPNDFVRVSRALEVYMQTARKLSEWQGEHGFAQVRHEHALFGVTRPIEELRVRIRARIQEWLSQDWVDEVRELHAQGYGDARAMGSLGFKEISAHLRGELPLHALEDSIEIATRIYVRRQTTWLRSQEVAWL